MLVYRIVHKIYSTQLHASGAKGRWNGAGDKVIYAAESIPLAFLENMVRRQGVGFNNDFKIMFINVPATNIASIEISTLPEGWRNFHDNTTCEKLGNAWYVAGETLVLKVPSAVLTQSCNYVINTEHKSFELVKLIAVTDLVPDSRIEAILKQYSKK